MIGILFMHSSLPTYSLLNNLRYIRLSHLIWSIARHATYCTSTHDIFMTRTEKKEIELTCIVITVKSLAILFAALRFCFLLRTDIFHKSKYRKSFWMNYHPITTFIGTSKKLQVEISKKYSLLWPLNTHKRILI